MHSAIRTMSGTTNIDQHNVILEINILSVVGELKAIIL
jgi:hypothetical protein